MERFGREIIIQLILAVFLVSLLFNACAGLKVNEGILEILGRRVACYYAEKHNPSEIQKMIQLCSEIIDADEETSVSLDMADLVQYLVGDTDDPLLVRDITSILKMFGIKDILPADITGDALSKIPIEELHNLAIVFQQGFKICGNVVG